jgi:hypothetical protein
MHMVTTQRSLIREDYLKIAAYWFMLVRRDLLLAVDRSSLEPSALARWEGTGIPPGVLQECRQALDRDWNCMRLVASDLRDQVCDDPPCFAAPDNNQLRQVLDVLMSFAPPSD